MNKELCIVLRDRLAGLPFVDRLSGMVQTVTREQRGELDRKVTTRFPVSESVLGEDCKGKEILMIPDSSRKSIIYFEDYGVGTTGEYRRANRGFNSSIRLICWLDRMKLVGDKYENVGAAAIAQVIARLTTRTPINTDIFISLKVEVSRIQPQDIGLFGRYTYDENHRQFLRPPFEFFGIDFNCTYFVNPQCIPDKDWNNPKC